MPKTVETCIYHGRWALKNNIFLLFPPIWAICAPKHPIFDIEFSFQWVGFSILGCFLFSRHIFLPYLLKKCTVLFFQSISTTVDLVFMHYLPIYRGRLDFQQMNAQSTAVDLICNFFLYHCFKWIINNLIFLLL